MVGVLISFFLGIICCILKKIFLFVVIIIFCCGNVLVVLMSWFVEFIVFVNLIIFVGDLGWIKIVVLG